MAMSTNRNPAGNVLRQVTQGAKRNRSVYYNASGGGLPTVNNSRAGMSSPFSNSALQRGFFSNTGFAGRAFNGTGNIAGGSPPAAAGRSRRTSNFARGRRITGSTTNRRI